jgi:hypothetical protein
MEKKFAFSTWKNKYDVIVVGGGTTGCCAALAAAREGAKVIIIEKHPFLGGNMTGGLPWLGFHAKKTGELVVKGIPLEIIERLQEAGGATEFVIDPIAGSAVGVNGNMLKLILADMLNNEGVDIILHSLVIDIEKKDNQVSGAYLQNKQGGQYIEGKVIVDCTDSADVCALAGADYVLGRRSDSQRQVSSNVIVMGDIDYKEMLNYFEQNPDQIRPFPLDEVTLYNLIEQMKTAPVFVLGAFTNIIKQAQNEGIDYQRKQLIGVAYPKTNELMLVSSRVANVDLNNINNHSLAEVDGMLQTWGILKLLHGYIPGCSRARIVSTGTQLGIRKSRHIEGDYLLTAEDLLNPTSFSDSIAKGGYHLDIHSPDHNGLETCQPPVYQIPYRSLLVKNIDGLLVAGRGISATHEALSSTRVSPISAAQGQAAGTAAALSAMENTLPRELDVNRLQKQLAAADAIY